MKNIHIILSLLVFALLYWIPGFAGETKTLSAGKIQASYAPYLSTDHKGNIIMSWLETEAGKEEGTMKFAVSLDKGKSFAAAITVPGSKGSSAAHGECPPKIAYKKDGTVYALFRISQPSESNPYAGDVYYTFSKDGGKNWSTRQSISKGLNTGRSYFDLKTLADGEVGAVWLEGKNKKDTTAVGSTIKFARTLAGNNQFAQEVIISKEVCQCCKTKLYVDAQKNIHVVFRKIFDDGSRDMAHATSVNSGKSFSNAQNINPDKWKINGCPHVGPDMVANSSGLHFVWYTMGGKGGIYTNSTKNKGLSYSPRTAITNSERASHPQIAALNDGSLITVWDESFKENEKYIRKIGIKNTGKQSSQVTYLDGAETLVHPVVTGIDNKTIFIAYTNQAEKANEIIFRVIQVGK